MATEVEIFKVDFSDSLNSISKLKAELKETRKLFEAAKPNTEDFIKYSTEVKRLDGSVKLLNNTTKENTNALGGVNKSAQFAAGSYGELKQKIDNSKKALLELNVESKEFEDEQKNLIALQNQRIEIEKKIPSLFQERIKGAIDESNALKQLRNDLKAAQSAALNGDGQAAKKVAELKDKIDDLKDSTKSLQGSGVERLNTSIGLLTQGFSDFDADKVKTGFKGIGAAMSAIPIILLIEGVKALIENFDEVVKFAKEITNTFSASEQAVKDLTVAVEASSIANKNLIATYTNEIALLSAKGGHEKELTELKKKKILVEIAEAENIVRLNSAKAAEILLNDSITDSIDRITISLLRKIGQDHAAESLEKVILKNKKERAKEELAAIQDAQQKIGESKTALQVLDIELSKKQTETAKENSKKRIDLYKEEQARLADIQNDAIDKAELKAKENNKIISDFITEDLNKQIEQDKKFKEDQLKRDVDRAKSAVIIAEQGGGNLLDAKQQLLTAERNLDVSNDQLTAEEKALINEKYREEQDQLDLQAAERSVDLANGTTSAIGDLTSALFDVKRSNLEKGSEEEIAAARRQFEVNKAFSIATTLISGAQAQISAAASVPYIPVGVAAQIEAGIITTAALVKIGNTKFQYKDGGYTEKGATHEEAGVVHKNEYVVPDKVLSTPKGSLIVSYLEGMRKGIPNPMPHIKGFFDGGFTGRSVSRFAETSSAEQNNLINIIDRIPAPVVRVTDINNVSRSNEKAVNVSSL